MPRVSTFAILVTVLLATGTAHATQHLVRPGENWEVIDARLKPGDEVILMTGRHRPCSLRNARGTEALPIVIRGLDPRNPALIEASRYGLRLFGPQHVRISDIHISGATINGLVIDGRDPEDADGPDAAGDDETPDDDEAECGGVVIERVTVRENGPKATAGQRHAIHLRHLTDVEVDSCVVEGWVGTGLEIVACRDVRVVNSSFIGLPDFVQSSGVRVRAGAERVRIQTSRFRNTGDQGVCIGARSKLEEFPPAAEERTAPRFEASRVQVRRCIFEDSLSAAAFVDAERSFLRNCTIIRPRRAVLSVRHEQKDPRFTGIHRCAFGSNLVVWEPGDIDMITHVGPGADASVLLLEQNVWWSPDLEATLAALGGFIGEQAFPQITDVDPKLDDTQRPTADEAASFGADWSPPDAG